MAATGTALGELLATDLSALDLVALLIDGAHFGDHLCVVVLGIDIDGTKHPVIQRWPRPWRPRCVTPTTAGPC